MPVRVMTSTDQCSIRWQYRLIVLDPTKSQHKVRLEGIDAPEKWQPFDYPSEQLLRKESRAETK